MDDEPNGRRDEALASRGVTRGFPVSILADPRWREAGYRAAHLAFCLRLYLHGPEGIGPIMGGRHALTDITGIPDEDLDIALEGATAGPAPLLRVEGLVYWVVNALEMERGLNVRDRKHRLRIQRAWEDLPNCSLKADFRTRYAEWWEDPSETLRRPLPESEKGLGRASKEPGQGLLSSVVKRSVAKRSEEKPPQRATAARNGSTPGDSGGWPARATEILAAVSPGLRPGRVGVALGEAVARFGEELVLKACAAWVKHALDAPKDKPFDRKVATFFSEAGWWVDSVTPGSGVRAFNRAHGEPDADPLPPERPAPLSAPVDPAAAPAPAPTSDVDPLFLRDSA